jgi:hypothetical protein
MSLGENNGKVRSQNDGGAENTTSPIDGSVSTGGSGPGTGGAPGMTTGAAGGAPDGAIQGAGGTPIVTADSGSSSSIQCDNGSNDSALELISEHWTRDNGEVQITCVRKTVAVDAAVTTLRLEAPRASRVVLSLLPQSNDAPADGPVPCSETSGATLVFSADAQSAELGVLQGVTLPTGTALHLVTGQRLVLQTQVTNTTSSAESGVSVLRAGFSQAITRDDDIPLPITLRSPADCAGFQPVLGFDWQVLPGQEEFLCVRKTLTTALDMQTVHVDTSAGTHDYDLSAGNPTDPDGTEQCVTSTPSLPQLFFHATGLSPQEFDYPSTLPITHVAAGQQLLLKVRVLGLSPNVVNGSTNVFAR